MNRVKMNRKFHQYCVPLTIVVMLSLVTMVVSSCAMYRDIYEPEAENKPKDVSKVISLEDFQGLITGKTKTEAKEIMGRSPDTVMANREDQTGHWSYFTMGGRSIRANGKYIYDSIVDKSADRVDLFFVNGKVDKAHVEF